MSAIERVRPKRNQNTELLKTVSILMIIAFHYVYHGKFGMDSDSNIIRFVSEIIYHLGELGVNCFILVSGYYLERTVFKPKKLLLMLLQVEFYVVICNMILLAFGGAPQWRARDLLPLLSGEYWFVAAYLLIYALQPFLKTIVKALDQRQLLQLILSQLFIWSLIPTLLYSTILSGNTESLPYFNRYIWCLLMYLTGFYLSAYPVPLPRRDFLHLAEAKKWMILVFPFELMLLFIIMGERGLWPGSAVFFWHPNSLLMVLMSVALFCAFRDWKPRFRCQWTRVVTASTLGIYLLHDGVLRDLFWKRLFHCENCTNLLLFIGQLMLAVGSVFASGIIIDTIRRALEKWTVLPIIRQVEKRIAQRREAT